MAVPVSNTKLSDVQSEIQTNCYTSGFCSPVDSLQEMFNATFNGDYGFDFDYYDGKKNSLKDFRNFSYTDRNAGTIDVKYNGKDSLTTTGGESFLSVTVEFSTTTWRVISSPSFVTSYNSYEQTGSINRFRIYVRPKDSKDEGYLVFSSGSHTNNFKIILLSTPNK